MTRVLFVMLWVAVLFSVACTSSSSSTPISTGSKNYDSEYRVESRGTQSNYGSQGDEIGDRPMEDPAITVMLMGMETGDVYPGEDYFVYAVVDNPDNRDLEYVWSVSNGNMAEVPEAERGRLATLVEDEYKTASAGPAPSMTPTEIPAEEPGAVVVPPEQQTPPATGADGTAPGVLGTPPNSGLPGATNNSGTTTTTDQNGETTTVVSGGDIITSTGGSSSGSDLSDEEKKNEERQNDGSGSTTTGNDDIEQGLQDLIDEKSEIEAELARDDLSQDERTKNIERYAELETEIQNWNGAVGGDRFVAGVLEQRMVAGDEEVSSENVEALAEQLAESVSASRPESGVVRPEPQGVTVAVESDSEGGKSWIGDDSGTMAPGRATGIRSEYSVWRDESTEPRKRLLGGYGSLNESEVLTEEESYGKYVYVTEEPYMMWTPSTPGPVNIYMIVRYKDEDLTNARVLPVDVRLREPEVKLSEEFPDILREDEFFYVAVDATNIPAFYKGLFTVTFDANKLSFRDAELGEFFDDTPQASLFYAEPDKMEGKVLLAIDSNRELTELGGNGVLVYAKFKAKQDINSRDETNIALVMDNSARYILDFNGENVLPLPVNRPAFQTDTVMPGDYPEYTREMTPGTEVPNQQQTSGQQQQTPGQTQQPGTYTPPATPTSTPPNNTGTTYSGNTGTTYSGTAGTTYSGQNTNSSQSTETQSSSGDLQVNHSVMSKDDEEEEAEGTETNDEVTTEDAEGDSAVGDGSTTEAEPEGDTTETGEATAEGEGEGTEPEPEPEPEGEGQG